MLATLTRQRRRLGRRGRRRSRPRPSGCRSTTRSFDLVFGHAVLHHIPDLEPGVRRVSPRPAPRRHGRLLRRALALRRPDRGAAEAGGAARGAALAPGARRRRPPASTARDRATATSSSARSTSTPSPPASCARLARRAGFDDVRIRGEELLANVYGWLAAHARVDRRARRGPAGAGAGSPSAATSPCSASTARCSSRGCRRSSSTTSCSARGDADRWLTRPALFGLGFAVLRRRRRDQPVEAGCGSTAATSATARSKASAFA